MNSDNQYILFKFEHSFYIFFTNYLTIYKVQDSAIVAALLNRGSIQKLSSFLNEYDKANRQNGPIEIAEGKDSFINSLILITTEDCNLRCNYCYAVDFNKKVYNKMDFATGKKAVDTLLQVNDKATGYGIVFFGGEPLLNFELIRDVVLYSVEEIVEKRKKSVGFTLTTNGTILTNNMITFLKKYKIGLTISLDGDRETHNRSRVFEKGKGSFDVITKNIKRLKDAGITFELRATLSPKSDLFRIVNYFENEQIPFGYGLVMDTKDKPKTDTHFLEPDIENLRLVLRKINDYYYEKIKKGEKIFLQNILSGLTRIVYRKGKEINCTAGRSTIAISTAGKILPCQNFVNYNDLFRKEFNEHYETETPAFKAPIVDNLTSCDNCWAKYLCAGGCFFEKYVENKEIELPSQSKCALTLIQWESIIELYIKLHENNLLSNQVLIRQKGNYYV